MTNGQDSMFVNLSRKTWWFITLSGLALLCLLMIFFRQGPIESDVKSRVIEHLTAYNADWISVELDGRGRDVLLTGVAPSVESRDLFIDVVQNIYGVRIVHDQLDIKPSLSSPELTIQQNDGTVLLGGRLASQTSIDAVVNAAKATYGNNNVVNELIISGQVKTADWLAATTGFLPRLVSMKSASLKISNNESLLTAEARSHGERLKLVYGARKLLGNNLDADVAVVVPPGSEGELGNAAKSQIAAGPEGLMLKACQARLDAEMNDKKVLFTFNTAELQTGSHTLLNQIIIVLEEECNEVGSEKGLTIAGHTDSLGDDDYNLTLSQRRADAVKAYFIDADGDVGLISSVGYGESQPVESNDTSKGRTQNRRIEFKIEHN